MTTPPRPDARPANPCFASGPCAKRPDWSLAALNDAFVGRSHRSGPGKAKLAEVIERSRTLLGLPDDYRVGIVPASDTGAIEKIVDEIIAANPDQAAEVKERPKALGWFVGQVMKASQGKANPQAVNEILRKKLGLG